jgi:hypothetical protein
MTSILLLILFSAFSFFSGFLAARKLYTNIIRENFKSYYRSYLILRDKNNSINNNNINLQKKLDLLRPSFFNAEYSKIKITVSNN